MSDNFDKLRSDNKPAAPKKRPRRSPFRRVLITLVVVLLLAILECRLKYVAMRNDEEGCV